MNFCCQCTTLIILFQVTIYGKKKKRRNKQKNSLVPNYILSMILWYDISISRARDMRTSIQAIHQNKMNPKLYFVIHRILAFQGQGTWEQQFKPSKQDEKGKQREEKDKTGKQERFFCDIIRKITYTLPKMSRYGSLTPWPTAIFQRCTLTDAKLPGFTRERSIWHPWPLDVFPLTDRLLTYLLPFTSFRDNFFHKHKKGCAHNENGGVGMTHASDRSPNPVWLSSSFRQHLHDLARNVTGWEP